MDHKYTALVDTVYQVKFGRSMALRRAVFNTPELYHEFRKNLTHREDTEEFSTKLREYIRQKGLRIISEKPVARIKDDRYSVDVYYEITW